MHRRILALALMGLVGAVAQSQATAQDKKADTVPNPYYVGWKAFKKNTTATVEEKTVYGGDSAKLVPGGVDSKTILYKLVEVGGDKAVVQTRVIERDFLSTIESAPTRITYPATVDKAHFEALVHEAGAKLTDAEVMVLGKKTACKVFMGSSKNGTEETTKKIVFSASVPGGIVEQVTTVKSGDKLVAQTTVKLKDFKAAE